MTSAVRAVSWESGTEGTSLTIMVPNARLVEWLNYFDTRPTRPPQPNSDEEPDEVVG